MKPDFGTVERAALPQQVAQRILQMITERQLKPGDRLPSERELGNVMERAVVLGRGPPVTMEDLPSRVAATAARPSIGGRSYREAMEDSRREVILAALARCRGNRAAAARSLGLHEKYLLRLLKSLGITA